MTSTPWLNPAFRNRWPRWYLKHPGAAWFAGVYLEVSKGFEIEPIRKVIDVGPDTSEIEVTVEKVIPWRERTYAKIDDQQEFTYESWLEAVKAGQTFVTYGPLLEFSVDGKPAGTRIQMSASGGTVEVEWEVSSVTVPMSRIELVVNGEIQESRSVNSDSDSGRWSCRVGKSSWLAILVRGHYRDKPEIIALIHLL